MLKKYLNKKWYSAANKTDVIVDRIYNDLDNS